MVEADDLVQRVDLAFINQLLTVCFEVDMLELEPGEGSLEQDLCLHVLFIKLVEAFDEILVHILHLNVVLSALLRLKVVDQEATGKLLDNSVEV